VSEVPAVSSVAIVSSRSLVLRRAIAVALGVAFVAITAHIAIPVPGTPVPMTMQPLAVLLVGGALGAALGGSTLVLYLALGIAGLPVFSPLGGPGGIASILGTSGGYLLSFPLAAAATGRIAGDGRGTLRVAVGVLVGLALIHLGGLAQLAILTGSVQRAAVLGTLPFVLGDLGKLALAIAVLRPTIPALRARL
jgi:biotin transport system substrate-specific component